MSFISLMDYSLSQPNPSAGNTNEHPPTHIDGFGNYNLQVFGALGSPLANSSVLNLYFLDSGDRAVVNGIRTYGWIKESQLLWLRGVSKDLQVELMPYGNPRYIHFLVDFMDLNSLLSIISKVEKELHNINELY